MVTLTPFPISTLPAPYDIVWCRFPYHDSLGEPGPKARPALVRNVAQTSDGYGEVHLVYGTTHMKHNFRKYDFVVSNAAEMDACGLYRATRFDLDKIAWIPWAEEWFDTLPGYTSPVIGRLTDHGTKLLQICASIKQVQAEMQAERALKAAAGEEDCPE